MESSRGTAEADNATSAGSAAGRSRLGLLCAALTCCVVLTSGCIGPRGLELTRLNYDQAVHETTEQQWLRNIVRLRYGDLPSFLDVSAITSQFELSSRAGFSTGLERDSSNKTNLGDLGLQFRDAPTLSYTPRDPSELTRTMLAPVGITAIGLVANTGWNLEDVIRLMVAEVNGLGNAPGAERLVPTIAPPFTPFADFAKLAESLRRVRGITLVSIETPETISAPIPSARIDGSDVVLAANNKLAFQPATSENALVLTRKEPAYKLVFTSASQGRVETEIIRELLGLSLSRSDFLMHRVERDVAEELPALPNARNTVEIRTRTLLEMLIVLSKGVRLPEEHVAKNLAAQAIGPDGVAFDWTQITNEMFHVCVQKKRPTGAAVAIEHQGYWFFIPQTDKRSTSTLSLIQTLFNLQLSEPKKAGPLLTLPVGL